MGLKLSVSLISSSFAALVFAQINLTDRFDHFTSFDHMLEAAGLSRLW